MPSYKEWNDSAVEFKATCIAHKGTRDFWFGRIFTLASVKGKSEE